jgi:hypothetical protein
VLNKTVMLASSAARSSAWGIRHAAAPAEAVVRHGAVRLGLHLPALLLWLISLGLALSRPALRVM